MFKKILENVHQINPIVHTITNYVTVNDCANIILAAGGSPIMADYEGEVEDITSISNSLVINIGTLNASLIKAMVKAGKRAAALKHPVILDPVGVGASAFRTETTFQLLKEIDFSVIRGNISEIKTIAKGSGTTKGVDADEREVITEGNLEQSIAFAKNLSVETGAVIAITGAIDIVADSKKAYVIRNGNAMMSKVSGTGCMLSTVIGSFCGGNPTEILESTAAAVCTMGLCGELASKKLLEIDGGFSTYRMLIIDYMSKLNAELLEEGMKIELR